MEKDLLLKGKKGVSIMIGYVLLIVIAIALSVMVFAYLKLYLPSERPSCPQEISLSIKSIECKEGFLDIEIENRGLFSIDGIFLRFGEPERIAKTVLNDGKPLFFVSSSGKLIPQESESFKLSVNAEQNSIYEAEIEPIIIKEDFVTLCTGAIARQKVLCE